MTTFCTADEIALAIVAAARLEGEEPEQIARGHHGSRARWYAFATLVDTFPDNDYRAIALGCGFLSQSTNANSRAMLASYRRGKCPKWWDEGKIQSVGRVLAGLHLGPAAAPAALPPQKSAICAKREIEPEYLREKLEPAAAIPEDAPLGPIAPPPVPVLRDLDALPAPRTAYPRRRTSPVTAAILGDPEPGRSALAQRNGGAA